jgi:hypothetical protein
MVQRPDETSVNPEREALGVFELPLPLLVMTVVGIVAFAASGAIAGARAGMDWLGVSTLAAEHCATY